MIIKPINLAKITNNYKKVKKAPNEALARTHYIKFLNEENKFSSASDKLEESIDNWSLKLPFDFCSVLFHFGKMCSQKLKSVYYYQKIQ